MKLLVQGDDFGFTRGVTCGIVDAIDRGVLRNTGLFSNMPDASFAVSYMKDRPEVCFGIDFNIVSGPSVSDKHDIPHLVDHDGMFIRSGERLKDARFSTENGRKEMFPYDEVYTEIRAQYEKFMTLAGKEPGYFHAHSLPTENYNAAIRQLSKETGIPYSVDIMKQYSVVSTMQIMFERVKKEHHVPMKMSKQFDPLEQLNKNPLQIVFDCEKELLKSDYAMIGGHPGFLDAELLEMSSLSIERIRDHEMLISEKLKNWIEINHVELITYYDLYQGQESLSA